jgi:hypothetical protein
MKEFSVLMYKKLDRGGLGHMATGRVEVRDKTTGGKGKVSRVRLHMLHSSVVAAPAKSRLEP